MNFESRFPGDVFLFRGRPSRVALLHRFLIAWLLCSWATSIADGQCAAGSPAASNIVLLDFRADWCGPCCAMDPIVQRLGAAGYPVRTVNIDQEKALAASFHVPSIPCFVLVVDGHEVQRIVGRNDISALVGMFRRAGYEPQGTPAAPAKQSRPPSPIVRIACRMPATKPGETPYQLGSGTVVDLDGRGLAMVITNDHVVRGAASIEVDFSNGVRAGGTLLTSDPTWDVAAIAIQAPANVQALTLSETAPQPGEPLTISGYGKGDFLTQAGRLAQYVAPGNGSEPFEFLELTGCAAREGDSGGPILNSRGQLAGMLDASDHRTSTVGPCCVRIRKLLRRWFHPSVSGQVNIQVPATPAPVPVATAAPPATAAASGAANADPLNLTGQLAAIKSELDSLVAGGGANAGGLSSINTQLTQLANQAGGLPALATQLQTLQSQVSSQLAALNKAITPAALQTALQGALPAISATPAAATAAGGLTLAQMLGLGSAAGVPGLLAAGALWLVGNGALKKITGATSAATNTPPPNASPPGGATVSSSPSAGPKPAAPAVHPSTPAEQTASTQSSPAIILQPSASQASAANKPAAPVPQNYVPYQDASINQAWQTAHAAVAKSYPGAVGALAQAERMVPQILSGMNPSLVPETAA